MSSAEPHAEDLVRAREHIRAVAGEIEKLSRRDLTLGEYAAEFLQRVVLALSARGGTVWLQDESGRLEPVCQQNTADGWTPDAQQQSDRSRLIQQCLSDQRTMLVPPRVGGGEAANNPTGFLLLLAPLVLEGRATGVVEVLQEPVDDLSVQQGYLTFLRSMCRHAVSYLQSRQLRSVSESHQLLDQVVEFTSAVHASIDLRETAYAIANEGQRILRCDRLSVCAPHGERYRLLAVSGQDKLEARSTSVKLLEEIATRVAKTGETLFFSGASDTLPPQLAGPLQEYADEVHARTLLVRPLVLPSRQEETAPGDGPATQARSEQPAGVLVVEQFADTQPRDLLERNLGLIEPTCAAAVANAASHSELFLLPLWRFLGRIVQAVRGRWRYRAAIIAALLLLVTLALVLVPTDLKIEASGTLMPVDHRDVFVAVDGVVTTIHVRHGQLVTAGEPLIELRNRELEIRLAELIGRRQTVRQQIRSVGRQLHEGVALTAYEQNELEGRLLELEKEFSGITDEYDLQQEMQLALILRAPIDGQVITWDVARSLGGRPVVRGQAVLTVAEPDGPWELEVDMPEKRMGHIMRAQERQQAESPPSQLAAEYALANEPGRSYRGVVEVIEETAIEDPTLGNTVRLRVAVDRDQLRDPRPGAAAMVQVNCGRHRLGYVWFHDLWEFLQRTILF